VQKTQAGQTPWSFPGTAGSANFSSSDDVGLLELQMLLASPLLCLSESSRSARLRGGGLRHGRWCCRMGDDVKLRHSSTDEHRDERLRATSCTKAGLNRLSSTARRPNSGRKMLDTENLSGGWSAAPSWAAGGRGLMDGRRRPLACRANVDG
jgi:hypothetical protein